MHYLGGKCRIAKRIRGAILARESTYETFLEPFMGAANATVKIARFFGTVIASDCHPDLILVWQALRDGWIPPDSVSESEYKALRHAPPSALRGFVGFACSFSGKWFGGYARDPSSPRSFAETARRAVLHDIRLMDNVEFQHGDYRQHEPGVGATVYCDPPYADTTGYAGGKFDSHEFWDTMRAWRGAGAHVYVSEYSAPPDWTAVLRVPLTRNLRGASGTEQVIESLYV